MTSKSEVNAEELDRVAQAPALAAHSVMLADRGGSIQEGGVVGKRQAGARAEISRL
jgi:hypothetical protein